MSLKPRTMTRDAGLLLLGSSIKLLVISSIHLHFQQVRKVSPETSLFQGPPHRPAREDPTLVLAFDVYLSFTDLRPTQLCQNNIRHDKVIAKSGHIVTIWPSARAVSSERLVPLIPTFHEQHHTLSKFLITPRHGRYQKWRQETCLDCRDWSTRLVIRQETQGHSSAQEGEGDGIITNLVILQGSCPVFTLTEEAACLEAISAQDDIASSFLALCSWHAHARQGPRLPLP